MSRKFTPGPWQVAGQFSNMTFVASTGKDADCICKCDTGDSESLPHAANARLIAAAPELLEALKELRRDWLQHSYSGDGCELGRKVLAAIHKATGAA